MPQWLKTTVDYGVYGIVRFLVGTIQVFPENKVIPFCRSVAWLLTHVIRIRGGTLADNLQRIFPGATAEQRQALTFQMWYHLILMVCEIAWAPRRLHRCNWKDHIHFLNSQEFLRQLLSRRATVLVTGHVGNFEIGGYVTGLMGINTVTIARPLDNPFLHRYVCQFREAKGQRLLDKHGCAAEVDRHLATGGTLSLLADQHAGSKGCWTPFLGSLASCHKGLALFTLTADAPMAVGYTLRATQPMSFILGCEGIADPRENDPRCQGVRQLTEWYNEQLGEIIARAPDQYWWVHRRWREPPLKLPKSQSAAA